MASCLTHFSHRHVLEMTGSLSQQFTCDLCETRGSGLHYRCDACDFDVHENCAKLRETISFFAHPWHNLRLAPAAKTDAPRYCDLCYEPVKGFFYRCISCNFDLHPHCANTKQTVNTESHPEHSLCLSPGLTVCSACNEFDGSIWVYRCGMCHIDLHIKCLHAPIKPNNKGSHRGRLRSILRVVGTAVAKETAKETARHIIRSLFSSQ